MRDWRKPSTRLRSAATDLVRRAAAASGRLVPLTEAEIARTQVGAVAFQGDLSPVSDDGPEQRRLVYADPRPQQETVGDLVYAPGGSAWVGGRLIRRYSVRAPSLRDLASKPPSGGVDTVPEAAVFESETPYTYGDWVGDFIRALVEADGLTVPVALPAFIADKAYVRRDIAALGLELIPVSRPLRIRTATVLRKTIPSYYWDAPQVAAYRRRFGFDPQMPRPGSLVYLSREHVTSEVVARSYPSAAVAAAVRAAGGTVFDTSRASPEAFRALEGEVETVVADQGSAIFGVLQWQVRNLIEITQETWWHNSNLFFADGAGVQNYAVIACNRYSDDETAARVRGWLKAFGTI